MSKIGKKAISVPSEVEVKIEEGFVFIGGPKGEIKVSIYPTIEVSNEGGLLKIKPRENTALNKMTSSAWGLARSKLANAIKGVTEGFEKSLEFEGVGYRASVKNDLLELNLGYSHPINVKIPAGLTFKVEKNTIKISGIDKELIGHAAAEIKSKRLPEPYKGSGIKYAGEVIKRKAGKKAATTA